jgi:hypothetical protein
MATPTIFRGTTARCFKNTECRQNYGHSAWLFSKRSLITAVCPQPKGASDQLVTLVEWTAILSAVAGVSATFFILIQLRHMDKHRDLEISLKLFDWAESDRLHKGFRWIEDRFQFENYEKYRAEVANDYEAIDYPYEVTSFFEEVGFLIDKKFIDIDIVADRLNTHIISNWKKLEPWIMALRKEKGDKAFGEHFQKLYEKTIAYMKSN